MFTLNRSLEKLDAPPSDVITLLVSTNRPLVSVSGPSQQADAFIISFRKGKTRPVVICFHIVRENERLYYLSDEDPATEPARIGLEQEAVRFVEDMGFMMVQERFDGFSPEKKHDFIMNLAPFTDDLAGLVKEREPGRRTKKEDQEVTRTEPEYEEVYEEVIEEVPVEETPPRPEEYESLSDIVHEISAEEKPAPGRQDRTEEESRGRRRGGQGRQEKAGSFDLAGEISEEVASIREMPQRAEPKVKDRIEKLAPAEQKARKIAPLDPETYQSIVRLFISL